MKLFFYELKKIFASPLTCLLCVLLLLLNVVLTAVSANNAVQASVPQKALDALILAYTQDEQAVLQEYEARQRVWEEYRDTIAKMTVEEAANYPPPVLPDIYATDERWTDEDVYQALFDLIEHCDTYQQDIASLLREAKAKYQAYLSDGTTNRAAILEQYRYLTLYHPLSEQVTLPLSAVHGWDVIFFSVFPDILCGVILLLLLSPLFTVERTENTYAVLRTTKRGRRTITLIKLASGLAIAVTAAVLVSVMTLLTVMVTSGVSDPTAPIQLLSKMKYCPWNMSLACFWLFSLGLKIVAFSALAMIVCGVSARASRAGQALLPGLVLWIGCAAGLFLPQQSFWSSCNLLSLANAYPVSTRYHGYKLFGLFCIDQLLACILLWVTIAVACGVYLVWIRGQRYNVVSHPTACVKQKRQRASVEYMCNDCTHKPRTGSLSLLHGEFEKVVTSRSCMIVLSLFLLMKAGQCAYDCRGTVSQSEMEYRNYTTTYAGALTEETTRILIEEKQQIDQTLLRYETMLNMVREGTISQDVWQAYVLEYADAYRRADAATRVVERLSDLSLQTDGKTPWLLYDTGWQRIFQRSADIVLILAVVYLSSVIFPTEYRKRASGGAFFSLLTTTKRGRLSVVFAKCGTAAMLGGGLAALSQALLILPLFVRDEWILSSAPLSSLALVMQSPDMAIQEYLIVCCTVRIVSIMLLSVSVCLLSALFKREIFTLLSVNIVLFFPHILTILGMQKAAYIDFLGVYSCTPLLALKNMSIATLFGYIVVQMAFIAVMSCLVYRHLYSWHLLYHCSSTQPSNNDVNNS